MKDWKAEYKKMSLYQLEQERDMLFPSSSSDYIDRLYVIRREIAIRKGKIDK